MGDNDKAPIHGSSEGGVSGKHDPLEAPTLLVGSTTADEFNSVTLRLIPIACFRVDDIRFAFNSSFLSSDALDEKKDIRAELKLLVDLLKDHPDSPLSVFGHADPVGGDDYNKALSGRRATVIYALLISSSDPDAAAKLWQGVAQEENWGAQQRQALQSFTGLPAGTADSDLFKAYMQKLSPAELKLTKQSFLAQGADPKGKGDYQGCSEFNPVLIFSTKRHKELESQTDKTARNDANAPNRRVMVLLFQKGTKIDPTKWPCPRATEGTGGCIKRFWSDGDKRRSTRLPDKDRKFDDTKDTLACRFYHRLVTNSPCESPLTIVKIRLFDAQARPLPFAPCLITEAGKKPRPDRATGAPPTPLGTTPAGAPGSSPTNGKEDAIITVRVAKLPTTINVKWSRPKAGEGPGAAAPEDFSDKEGIADKDKKDKQKLKNGYKYEFEMDVIIDIPDADAQAAASSRLKNLGYVNFPKLPDTKAAPDIKAFQKHYKARFGNIVEDGTLNQPTIDAIKTTHDSSDPVLKAGSETAVKR